MLEQLYEWIRNIAVYLVVTAGVMHIVPGKEYAKYIRFFSGLVLILLLASPLLRLAGLWTDFSTLYRNREYQIEAEEIEKAAEVSAGAEIEGLFPEEYGDIPDKAEEKIEVEEIRIGE